MQYGCQKLWPDLDWFWLAAAWWGYKKCASSSVQKWRRHDVQMLAASILGFIDRDRPNIPLQSFLKGALSTSHTRCCFLGMPTIQKWQCPSYRYPLLCFKHFNRVSQKPCLFQFLCWRWIQHHLPIFGTFGTYFSMIFHAMPSNPHLRPAPNAPSIKAGTSATPLHGMEPPGCVLQAPVLITVILEGREHLGTVAAETMGKWGDLTSWKVGISQAKLGILARNWDILQRTSDFSNQKLGFRPAHNGKFTPSRNREPSTNSATHLCYSQPRRRDQNQSPSLPGK